MAIAFTQEQKDEIQEKLIEAGFALSTSIGFKKMTVATVAKSAGVAVGSFYIFFDSKENFVLALIKEAEKEAELRMATVFEKDGTIPFHVAAAAKEYAAPSGYEKRRRRLSLRRILRRFGHDPERDQPEIFRRFHAGS